MVPAATSSPSEASAVVTKVGSKSTTARRRTAGRSAAIVASIKIRVTANSPSVSHPSIPGNGSDIVPELAVSRVYVTGATSAAGHPASIAAAAASAAAARHDSGRPWLRRLLSADAAATRATTACQ
jgi:hypothetical protein